MGWLYDEGFGVQKDAKQAVFYYQLAAAKGHADAAFSLGLAYEKGSGVHKDNAEAAKWLKLAAKQGNAKAQAELDAMQNRDQLAGKK
jgi:TPR repeat protein